MKNELDVLDIPKKETAKKEFWNEKIQEEKKFTALCTNCDERFSCKIRNNASIIWHCEEYK